MNEKPEENPGGGEGGEELFNGIPHRLLDDYDGGSGEPREGAEQMLKQLMEGAPPELKARMAEWEKQKAELAEQPAAEGEQPKPE